MDNELQNEDLTGSSNTEKKDEQQKEENTNFSCLGINEGMSEELKLVSQLDNVTKETEQNATAVFDILHDLLTNFEDMNNLITELKSKENISKEDLEDNLMLLEKYLNHSNNILFEGMSLMQYQDISRQKIERVVNIMRTLIKYLNHLFEGAVDDTDRTSSAHHIKGDHTDDVVDNENLDDLINSFQNGNNEN